MRGDDALELLGFPRDARPSFTQVKAAYKKKVWESHPDRFPEHEKSRAESRFKMISEAYSCLQAGARPEHFVEATQVHVVRRGFGAYRRTNSNLVKAPFILLIFGTVSLGGFNAARAYRRQKEECPSHNPFLP